MIPPLRGHGYFVEFAGKRRGSLLRWVGVAIWVVVAVMIARGVW